MRLLNIKSIAVILATVLMISGCATSQNMSSEDRNKIKSVQISQTVEKGQVFLLAPGGASVGLMFGAVGGLASAGAISDSQTAFVEYLKKNNIFVEKLVQEEFESALRASGKLALVASSESTVPTIKLSVPQYGFGVTHLLGSNVVPVLQIKS
jgi:PBP1b-binding outer membrane lipoprotein LpoB